ncbi:hypothetical protein N510_003040 [Firmicutes bacterium ASF500]|nr:hypothetical protein N510_003040 [Firmicutes bacterium ASF500]
MKPKQIVKIVVDVAMTLGMLFQMGYHLWGDTAHEWVGAGLFLLFLLHHILNWRWWTGLFKGKYTAVRILQTTINLLTLAAMLGLMVSGVILSSKVFAFLQIRGHMAFARRLHMAASYWGFFLMTAHLSLHWGMLLGMVRKAGKTRLPGRPAFPWLTLLGVLVTVYGTATMVKRDLVNYLFLRSEFVFLDFSESKMLFYLDYLAIMGTFIFLAHFAAKLLRKRKERKTL